MWKDPAYCGGPFLYVRGSHAMDCDPFDKPLSPKNIYIMINKSSKITVMKQQGK